MHKAGFVNIIGNPNAGKSTTMNALLGEKLSIITPKAQTTRHRIFGIYNGEGFQAVFSDTPGIIQPAYALQESMMKFVDSAFEDADIFMYITETGDRKLKNDYLFEALQKTEVPILLCLNKIDLIDQKKLEAEVAYWKEVLPKAEVIPVSVLKNFQMDYLLARIKDLLPESPPYFDEETLTDRSERFFATEIIREKVLMTYQKEIPYSVEVIIEDFIEEPDMNRIRAVIFVERDSQKGIIIGHQGSKLKKVGTEARKDLEKMHGKKVFLELYVKVDKDWRQDLNKLKRYGY